jgi:hypothetical protein
VVADPDDCDAVPIRRHLHLWCVQPASAVHLFAAVTNPTLKRQTYSVKGLTFRVCRDLESVHESV